MTVTVAGVNLLSSFGRVAGSAEAPEAARLPGSVRRPRPGGRRELVTMTHNRRRGPGASATVGRSGGGPGHSAAVAVPAAAAAGAAAGNRRARAVP